MKKWLTAMALLVVSLLLCGCGILTTDSLYTLPKTSQEFQQLQNTLDALIASGAEYSAPTAGSNRQTVQMEDLDADGRKEAIAFLNFEEDDNPLKIYIFRWRDSDYEQAAVIEGEGSGFDSVSYVDMDGDGTSEIVLGRLISTDIKMLSIYSIRDYQVSQLAVSDYLRYSTAQLREEGKTDVILLRKPTADVNGEAQLFSMTENGEVATTQASLSANIQSVLRIRSGKLTNGLTGIYVESTVEDGSLLTDIFVFDSKLINISNLNESNQTLRSLMVYCQDINEDGILEVPCPVSVQNSEDSSYWQIYWNAFSSSGNCVHVMTTYHNSSDGWFFSLPDTWIDKVKIRRVDTISGERTIVMSCDDDSGRTRDFLKIYAFSGSNREERAKVTGRFMLAESGDIVYAAEILPVKKLPINVTEEIVQQNFNVIYSEWETGESN